jgi:hypothetical protein
MTKFKPCAFCGNVPDRMTELEDKDDRRYFERTLECDYCELTMRDSIHWGQYSKMTREKASEAVGKLLVDKWNALPRVGELMKPYLEHTIECRSRYMWANLAGKVMEREECDCGLDDLLEEYT